MKELSINDWKENPVTMFGRDWCLVCAGNKENGYNAMTIAWGEMGAVWDRNTPHGKIIIPTATVFIRPQRYTKKFIDREEYFTISSFAPQYKKALGYMGSHSGRDGDKIAQAGLTPYFVDDTTCIAEARLVLVCRKMYQAALSEDCFIDKAVMEDNYPKRDFHDMYVGEIVKVLAAEDYE